MRSEYQMALAAPPSEPWVGVSEAARHLSCATRRIYDLTSRRDQRRIPHRKDGARLLFRLSEIDRWLDHGGQS